VVVRPGALQERYGKHECSWITGKSGHTNLPASPYMVTQNKLLLPIPVREVTLDNLLHNPQ
jgi:hypothetical protein